MQRTAGRQVGLTDTRDNPHCRCMDTADVPDWSAMAGSMVAQRLPCVSALSVVRHVRDISLLLQVSSYIFHTLLAAVTSTVPLSVRSFCAGAHQLCWTPVWCEPVASRLQYRAKLGDGRSCMHRQRMLKEGVGGRHTAGGGQLDGREHSRLAQHIESAPTLIRTHTTQSFAQTAAIEAPGTFITQQTGTARSREEDIQLG